MELFHQSMVQMFLSKNQILSRHVVNSSSVILAILDYGRNHAALWFDVICGDTTKKTSHPMSGGFSTARTHQNLKHTHVVPKYFFPALDDCV